MIAIVIGLLIFMLAAAAVWWVGGLLELPDQLRKIALAVLVIAFVVYCIYHLRPWVGGPPIP